MSTKLPSLPSLQADDVLQCLAALESPPSSMGSPAPPSETESTASSGEMSPLYEPYTPCPHLISQERELAFIKVYVNGYRRAIGMSVPLNTPVATLKDLVWRKQREHPHAMLPNTRSRAVFLRHRVKTMNTTCKFDQDDQLLEVDPITNRRFLLQDVLPLDEIYLCE